MPHNLPLPRTSFVGRAEELQSLAGMIGERGLVTLIGAGGSGKTRLAIELTRRVIDRFPDGIWWVDLAPVPAGVGIPPAVSSALRIGLQAESEALTDVIIADLRDRSAVLLLDNCEHLINDVAEFVDRLASSCPSLLVLTTSREPLRVAGEAIYTVPPLRVEDDAVTLFIERSRDARSDIVIGESDAEAVHEICERLDGMPLAIELAAPWLRMMSLTDLRARLVDRFALLITSTRGVPNRQRTLRATVDWSHERLTPDERVLFRRLAVFPASFSLTAAERVCSDDIISSRSLLNLLSELCDRSMVGAQPNPNGETRYRLLETLRQFALERLREAGGEERLQRRHFEYFLDHAESADDTIRTTGSDAEITALIPDMDNFRSALRWSVEADPNGALQLAGALDHVWVLTGAAEGRRWLEATLAKATAPSRARARALAAIVLPATDPSWPRGRDRIEESLRISTEFGDETGRAWALHVMGMAAWMHAELIIARDYLSQALPLNEEQHNAFAVERTLHMLGCTLINIEGGLDEGMTLLSRAHEMARELHDRWGEQYALAELALAAMDLGDSEAARRYLLESLACGDRGVIISVPLAGVARLVAETEPVRAATLLAAARAINERTAGRRVFHLAFCNHSRAVKTLEEVESSLDRDRFDRAWDAGFDMSAADAIAFAVETAQERSHAQPGGLTAREIEIVGLIAAGLSNKEIATTLYLSVRTVEAHLDHVFTKLGLNSRIKVATWARDAGLLASSRTGPTPKARQRSRST